MIRTQNKVPDYYIEKSRDFQVLCRVLDFLLNSTKYNSESLMRLTDTERAKNTVLPLIGDMFGIYDKDAYSMREMLDALPCALKNKGSLHAALTLINAFLDSMDVFDFATVYNVKDDESVEEVSQILGRPVKPYSLVIILSSYPNLTKLRILDTYLKMVIPTGMYIDYAFGFTKTILDKYIHKDFVILYYTKESKITEEDTSTYRMTSTVFGSNDRRYVNTSVFDDVTFLTDNEKTFMKNITMPRGAVVDDSFTDFSVIVDSTMSSPEISKWYDGNAYLTNTVGIASVEQAKEKPGETSNVVGFGRANYMII